MTTGDLVCLGGVLEIRFLGRDLGGVTLPSVGNGALGGDGCTDDVAGDRVGLGMSIPDLK